MVIRTLVRLKEGYGTEQRVGPPCKYVRSGARGSWCQDRVIDVTAKRQVAALRPNIRRSDDQVFSDLTLHRNVHLIRARPLEIRCHREEASARCKCPLVREGISANEIVIGIAERSSQRDACRICLLVDISKGQPGGEGLEVRHCVPLIA